MDRLVCKYSWVDKPIYVERSRALDRNATSTSVLFPCCQDRWQNIFQIMQYMLTGQNTILLSLSHSMNKSTKRHTVNHVFIAVLNRKIQWGQGLCMYLFVKQQQRTNIRQFYIKCSISISKIKISHTDSNNNNRRKLLE